MRRGVFLSLLFLFPFSAFPPVLLLSTIPPVFLRLLLILPLSFLSLLLFLSPVSLRAIHRLLARLQWGGGVAETETTSCSSPSIKVAIGASILTPRLPFPWCFRVATWNVLWLTDILWDHQDLHQIFGSCFVHYGFFFSWPLCLRLQWRQISGCSLLLSYPVWRHFSSQDDLGVSHRSPNDWSPPPVMHVIFVGFVDARGLPPGATRAPVVLPLGIGVGHCVSQRLRWCPR